MLDEFQKWQYDAEQAIKEWPDKLVEEALEQNNNYFGKAKRWLEKKRPEIPDNFHGKPEEQFIVTIREIYTEAIIKLKNLAMRQQMINRSK
jgi:hypothetical protein